MDKTMTTNFLYDMISDEQLELSNKRITELLQECYSLLDRWEDDSND